MASSSTSWVFAHDRLSTTTDSDSQSTSSEGPQNVCTYGPIFCKSASVEDLALIVKEKSPCSCGSHMHLHYNLSTCTST